MFSSILELITLGAKIFTTERESYFKAESKRLQAKIYEVADSDFYNKDMEAKGKAERELERQTSDLMAQFIREAKS